MKSAKRQPYWHVELAHNDKGHPYPNISNALRVLHLDPTLGPDILWYDEFLDRIMWAREGPVREWNEEDIYSLTSYMQDQPIGITNLPDHIVKKTVLTVAKQRTKHCVRDWLSGLKWDGEDRLDLALEDHWGVVASATQPVEYVRAVSRNFFLALVARIYDPGCKLDEMVVFEGRTGAKKSMALEVVGGAWHAVAHSRVTEKDFFQDFQGQWVMVVEELNSFTKAEVERIKSVITTSNDNFRGSYDARSSKHPRQNVLTGTTNRDDWGHDETGLRRFMPVVVGDITPDTLAAARDQLFAEAVHRFKAHEMWWIYPSSAADVQYARQDYDEWTQPVMKWCAERVFQGSAYLTAGEILVSALGFKPGDVDKRAQMRIGRILTLSRWERQLLRIDGVPCRRWIPPATTDLAI